MKRLVTHSTWKNRRSQEPQSGLAVYSDHGGYISGLDGLRAIAVLAVILYHVAPGVFPGGFLGVDVFFVISGFLITTLLLREKRKTGAINLGQFWVRRARRLLPAFVALIIIVVPLAWAVSRDLLVGIGRQVLGALTFSTNWLEIAHGSSYFDQTTPLLFKNFWSLAIEEQFYLLWPLVMLLLVGSARKLWQRLSVASIMIVSSASAMGILYNPQNVTRVYYGTDTHLFGIALGIIVAFCWADRRAPLLGSSEWIKLSQPVGIGALGVIIVAICVLPDTAPGAYRGVIVLISALSAVLIAAMLQPQSFLARIFDHQIFRWIGERSYGLYLWHWPILVIVSAAYPVTIGSIGYWIRALIALLLTAGACELSLRFIEYPIRHRGFRAVTADARETIRRRIEWQIAAGVSAVLLLMTIIVIATAPAKSSTTLAIEKGESVVDERSTEQHLSSAESSELGQTDRSHLVDGFHTSLPHTEEITAIGDSMIAASKTGFTHVMPGIRFIAKSNTQWKDAKQMIADGLNKKLIGRGVILSFGTNAGVPHPQEVREVLDLLGSHRMIVLMNLYSPSTFIASANKELAAIADEYANVTLADWNSYVSTQPALLQVDQTHPSIQGAVEFAQLSYQTMKEFSAQLSSHSHSGKNDGK
ncbi:acyltransferase family protein [Arcanobacterium canis]